MKTSTLRNDLYTVRITGPRKINNLDELREVFSERMLTGREVTAWGRNREGKMFAAGNLKYYRRWAKMTQAELAKSASISFPHHISEMESGKRPIGKKMARTLAVALGVERLWHSFLSDL